MSTVMKQASKYGDEEDGVEANFRVGHALRNGGVDQFGARGSSQQATRSLGSRVQAQATLRNTITAGYCATGLCLILQSTYFH